MELNQIIEGIGTLENQWLEKAKAHTAQLAIPPRALGRLHQVSEKLAAIQGSLKPDVDSKAFLVMAGDHGVAAQGVSAFPQEVTGEMVKNFIRGGASINVLARRAGARVLVVDMGVIPDLDPGETPDCGGLLVRKLGRGTNDMTQGPAMSREKAEQAVLIGFNEASALIQGGVRMLGTGDMGIANTTPSTAIAAAVTGKSPRELAGRGTGVDDQGLERKVAALEKALETNRPDPGDGIDLLSKVGGFEIGGIAGVILAGAYHRAPVVVDGLISTAGALVAQALCPASTDYLFSGHASAEPGHSAMLGHLGLEPILDLGMRLGEGTGAALAMQVIESAARVFCDVLTFEQAQVSQG